MEFRKDIMTVVERMERHKGDEDPFFEAWQDLKAVLSTHTRKLSLSPEVGNELAERIIAVFEERRAFTPLVGGYHGGVAARFGTNERVKAFIIDSLGGKDTALQDETLHGLVQSRQWRGSRGVFNALERLLRKGSDDDIMVLAVMEVIDPDRALPHLEQVIDTIEDPMRFCRVAASVNLCKSFALLERVILRIPHIPEPRQAHLDLLMNVSPELLLAYIKSTEGDDLRAALEAFVHSPPTIRKRYALLIAKLQSKNPSTRHAVVRCLNHMAREGTWANNQTLSDLRSHIAGEKDNDVLKEAQDGIAWLEHRLGGRP